MEKNSSGDQYVIGIGASAGGLEAINELFDNMPSTTGFTFVIVQHLSPDHRSMMAELLSKHTGMPVYETQDGTVPRPDSIYLIPSKMTITLRDGKLRLSEKVRDHQPNNAIDIFFESLAKEKAEKAVGIILSGTGSDGTKGIQAIKNNGGSVIVQDPITAQFDGMPNSAVASGHVDLILSPDMIPDELLDFLTEAPLLRSFNALTSQEEATLLEILELVYKVTGHDFSNYKRPTINRRLAKRMAEKRIRSISDYYNFIRTDTEEIKRLCREFLLHVTRFFRDEDAFETLKMSVIPGLVSKASEGDVIKIWTVACSTGEEAYSLAILFDEYLRKHSKHNIEVKIFATDISQEVIDAASRGFYTSEQTASLSLDRLNRYFVPEGHGYRVDATLRRMIVFARHNIAVDPPFSKIDLLTCRNMLIYVNPALQKIILHKFHFALNEGGYLFLGPSENIGVIKDAMTELDRKWKIYQCISKTKMGEHEIFNNPFEKPGVSAVSLPKAKNALNHLSEIFKDTLLEEYGFAGIFIDKDFEVKQAIGNFKKFMDFPENTFNFNLLKLVPTDLSIVLSTGIRTAIKNNERVVKHNVKISSDKYDRNITVIIKPYLTNKNYLQPFLFIVLKEEEPLVSKKTTPVSLNSEETTSQRIEELELELGNTKENLQALLEEVESSNEELQSSNEEIISANEELQSTNEELQSLNEELHTVNAEHQLKIKELVELNDDLNNYFRNTEIGQILIDGNLVIRKFTPVATRQVNLIASDIGRSIVDISTNMKNIDFINDIKLVMKDGIAQEKEILLEDGQSYLMRIAPYMRQNGRMDGVVVNFMDVTEVKKLSSILEAVYNSSTSGIIAMQAVRNEQKEIVDFTYLSTNAASRRLLQLDSEITGNSYRQMYGHVNRSVFETYVRVTETGNTESFEYRNEATGRWFDVVATKMMDGLVITFNDITDRKSASERIQQGFDALQVTSTKLKETNDKLEQSNFDLLQFASVASHDLKEPLRKVQIFGNLLKEKIETKLDDSELNYLTKIVLSTNRMQVLIDDILTLSRLSQNNTPHSVINLEATIRQITEDLEISIRDKHAQIIVKKLPVINGISGQIHQVFQNLISNAIKFSRDKPVIELGEEKISEALAAELEIDASDYVGIYIQDNGIGFEPEFSEKIFGIFQRLEKTHYQGTGIGLAIVKKIVLNHNGFIKAIGEPGKGSRFVLLFPKNGTEKK